MDAFDAIEKQISLRDVTDEWRIEDGDHSPTEPRAGDMNTNCESLPDELNRVICCSVELLESRSACRESIAILIMAFERVLQAMASCESRLGSLLAVQGESAMQVLEALQMVRRLSSLGHVN
jgi:hypothetical protein